MTAVGVAHVRITMHSSAPCGTQRTSCRMTHVLLGGWSLPVMAGGSGCVSEGNDERWMATGLTKCPGPWRPERHGEKWSDCSPAGLPVASSASSGSGAVKQRRDERPTCASPARTRTRSRAPGAADLCALTHRPTRTTVAGAALSALEARPASTAPAPRRALSARCHARAPLVDASIRACSRPTRTTAAVVDSCARASSAG